MTFTLVLRAIPNELPDSTSKNIEYRNMDADETKKPHQLSGVIRVTSMPPSPCMPVLPEKLFTMHRISSRWADMLPASERVYCEKKSSRPFRETQRDRKLKPRRPP